MTYYSQYITKRNLPKDDPGRDPSTNRCALARDNSKKNATGEGRRSRGQEPKRWRRTSAAVSKASAYSSVALTRTVSRPAVPSGGGPGLAGSPGSVGPGVR